MAGPNTCYFSQKCRFCQAFFQELHQSNLFHEFRFVCVDPSPSRPPLPAWLKKVPTIVIAGESEPRVGPSEVNNWLFARKMLGNKPVPQTQTHSTQRVSEPPKRAIPEPISASTPANSKQGPPPLANSDMEGIEPWHGEEMGGGNWSDGYSFLNESFTSEKGINPIIRNFESLVPVAPVGGKPGVGAKGGVGSAGFSASSAPRSAKEEKLLNEFEAYAKSRDMEFAGPRRIG